MNVPKCDICGADAIYYERYNNKHLCINHFLKSIEKRFFSTVREFRMVRPHERIAVALSGGKDSSVLLYLLHKLSKKMPFEIIAITIDEGIQNYRDVEIENAKAVANALGIEHHIISFKSRLNITVDDIAFNIEHASPCSYCGVFRRRLLNEAAKDMSADKLAVGHNLDDAVQTLMLNIMRNEPLRIARYFFPIVEDEDFVPRIRPLIRIPEKEVSLYAFVKKIKWQFRECPYARFSLRYTVRRKINEIEDKYPGTKFRMLSSLITISQIIKDNVPPEERILKRCKVCGMPTSQDVCMFCQKLSEVKRMMGGSHG